MKRFLDLSKCLLFAKKVLAHVTKMAAIDSSLLLLDRNENLEVTRYLQRLCSKDLTRLFQSNAKMNSYLVQPAMDRYCCVQQVYNRE